MHVLYTCLECLFMDLPNAYVRRHGSLLSALMFSSLIILLVTTQSLSLLDKKNDKVNAVKCVFILYRTHLNFLPVAVISNLRITIFRCPSICTSKWCPVQLTIII